jgi:ABC-type glycerol-3-phosphate transport system substrate-binding protein
VKNFLKSSLQFASLGLASALVLTGCASSTTTAEETSAAAPTEDITSEPITLSFMGPEAPETFVPVIEGFEALYPNISVNYEQIPFDQLATTIEQRIGSGDSSVDVYTVDQPWLAQYAAKGYLEDLSYMADEAKAAMPEAMYNVNFYNDKMYAVSIWNSTQMMFYNKDMLDAAGVEYPSADPAERWTWEEIDAASQKIIDSGAAQYGYLLEQVIAYYQFQAIAESAGGGSGIVGDDMLSLDLANDGWTKALTWYQNSFKSGHQPTGVGGFDTGPMFSDKKLAFFVGGPWDVGIFGGNDVNWGVAPHPYFEGGSEATPTGSWSWGMNPASENKAAAAEFLKYASIDADGNLKTTEALTVIPANKDAAAAYLPGLETDDRAAGVANIMLYETQNTARTRPTTVGYVQFDSLFSAALEDIRNGTDISSRIADLTAAVDDAWMLFK